MNELFKPDIVPSIPMPPTPEELDFLALDQVGGGVRCPPPVLA